MLYEYVEYSFSVPSQPALILIQCQVVPSARGIVGVLSGNTKGFT